jgi:hypothetical protein
MKTHLEALLIREITNKIKNMTKSTLAISAAVLARNPNPSMAATIATIKNTNAHPNIHYLQWRPI